MHCRHFLLVVAVVFFASANAAVTTMNRKSLVAEQVELSVKRALRANSNAGEERAFSASVTEGLSNWVTRAAPKLLLTDNELEHLAMKVTSTDQVFKMLKLDDGLDGILRNPNLKAFSNYVRKVDTTNPDQVLITTLINQYGDETLARFLFEAKHVAKTEESATTLQAMQFIKWFDEGKTPNQIFRLLDLRHISAYEDKFHSAVVGVC